MQADQVQSPAIPMSARCDPPVLTDEQVGDDPHATFRRYRADYPCRRPSGRECSRQASAVPYSKELHDELQDLNVAAATYLCFAFSLLEVSAYPFPKSWYSRLVRGLPFLLLPPRPSQAAKNFSPASGAGFAQLLRGSPDRTWPLQSIP